LWEKIIKKLPPAACSRLGVALRATWGVLRPPGDLGRNKYYDPVITNPTPLLPISQKFRTREEERKKERKKIFFRIIIFYRIHWAFSKCISFVLSD
jgi:hypothetical protein